MRLKKTPLFIIETLAFALSLVLLLALCFTYIAAFVPRANASTYPTLVTCAYPAVLVDSNGREYMATLALNGTLIEKLENGTYHVDFTQDIEATPALKHKLNRRKMRFFNDECADLPRRENEDVSLFKPNWFGDNQ